MSGWQGTKDQCRETGTVDKGSACKQQEGAPCLGLARKDVATHPQQSVPVERLQQKKRRDSAK